MKITVVGPGALGSLFGALLGRAGHRIQLLDHQRPRAALLAARGLLLEENGRKERVSILATTEPAAVAGSDLIFLCVKSGAVGESLAAIASFLSPSSLLIACQNGIGHLEPLRRLVPADRRSVAVTAQGATLIAPGHVRHGGSGPTRLGVIEPPVPAVLTQAAGVLTAAGIPALVEGDISQAIWRKLLANAAINALTALHDCPNGHLAADSRLRKELSQAVAEGAAVAKALKVEVGSDPVADVLAICRATAENISSMLQDVRRRRRTEIDAINGAIVAEARRLGIPVPVNERLLQAVKAREGDFG
ncbi:MAG: 2-dehydropantoate 2-reductase [Desulfobacteraceae bacterium]|nr:2-dehydropantoate 2-reductase [Desulfobacteraceae bacterium]